MSKTKYYAVLCVGALVVSVAVTAIVDLFAPHPAGFIVSCAASGIWGMVWGIIGERKVA